MSKLVKIESEDVVTITVTVEDDKLRREVLGYLLEIDGDELDKVMVNAQQFAFTGTLARDMTPNSIGDLTTDAFEVLCTIAASDDYWIMDRFVYQVQMEIPSKE